MEPISTCLLVASLFAGPIGSVRRTDPNLLFPSSPVTMEPNANIKVIDSNSIVSVSPVTSVLVSTVPSNGFQSTNKNALFEELITFLDQYNDPISSFDDILSASLLIQKIPNDMPMPILMRNDEGDIGMYWDDNNTYIDINIEDNGRMSLYSNVRLTEEKNFIDAIDINTIDSNWINEKIGTLLA